MKSHWLSSSDWKFVQSSVPVACVDVLPVRFSATRQGKLEAVGLILRDTPQKKPQWCLIGGRLLYGESLDRGIRRQMEQTLGPHVRSSLRLAQQPLYIAQYSPSGRKPFSLDLRQHSVALTYAAEFKGETNSSRRGQIVSVVWTRRASSPPAVWIWPTPDRARLHPATDESLNFARTLAPG